MEITKGQQVYANIIEKALNEEKFKINLMQNPVETIENFTGEKLNLPEGKKLVVQDQSDESTVYFNIPHKANYDDVELNENQLEAVSGGGGIIDLFTNVVGFFNNMGDPNKFH